MPSIEVSGLIGQFYTYLDQYLDERIELRFEGIYLLGQLKVMVCILGMMESGSTFINRKTANS